MKTREVPASWLRSNGMRLDCGPYVSGAIEARVSLSLTHVQLTELSALTIGGRDGIFHPGRIRRIWVRDLRYGVPFLGSVDIFLADLRNMPLIAHSVLEEHPGVLLSKGATLITRSSSSDIGRAAYCRSEFDGLACTEDVLRIVPDPDKIPSGYLFAFLSSPWGIAQVVQGSYGAIMNHLEPPSLWGVQIPRFGASLESRIHGLVEAASEKRTEASRLIASASNMWPDALGLTDSQVRVPNTYSGQWPVSSSVVASACRFDATYFSPGARAADGILASLPRACRTNLQDVVCDVFVPGMFKRAYATDPAHGVPYLTGREVYYARPSSDRYLLSSVVSRERLKLGQGMILIHDSGQVGGLIGRAIGVSAALSSFSCTNNMIRVVPHNRYDQGFLLAFLDSEFGRATLVREAAGSSIPHLDCDRIRRVRVPWPDPSIRKAIGLHVVNAHRLKDEATEDERHAQSLLNDAFCPMARR
jgi:type I restriction enzyme S subunit